MTRLVLLAYAALVGASVGSFLNVCIGRWPAGESVVRPRSRCPACGGGIAWRDNVPVLGWLLLRGRCRQCRAPISAQYPAVELAVAVLWFACAWWLGPTFTALRVAIFATLMLGVAITDARSYLIPDGFTVSGLAFVLGTSVAGFFLGDPGPFATPGDALLGACAGAGALSIVGWLGEVILDKEAMGFGDVTLMAVVGAAVGPTGALAVVFVGAALGVACFLPIVAPLAWWRGRPLPQVPFGVFLAPAAVLWLLWGEGLRAWYVARMLGA